MVAGIAAFNDAVRQHVANVLSGDRSGELATVVDYAGQSWRSLSAALGDYGITHAPLVEFGLVALVLFVLTFRS